MANRSLADGLPGDDVTALPLARRPDFQLGAATVRPSIRTIEGPAGSATAEPRVMQVLLAFADADGAVLTRDDLLRICWDGRIVGDDSLNRAIAEVRRIAQRTEAGFGIETIPRIGYRLTGATPDLEGPNDGVRPEARPAPGATRRWVMAGGAVAAVAGLGAWAEFRPRTDPRLAGLIEHGEQALRDELPDSGEQGVTDLREAVSIDPGNAKAWGLLALAHRNVAENTSPEGTTTAIQASESAARRALAIDPGEGNALTALATVQPFLGDWIGAEDRLTKVLAVAPDTEAAMSHLVSFLQSVGRDRDSWIWNERAATLDPLSPIHQFRRALKFWIFGRVPDADLVIERALQLWPRHPAVWNARLTIFAFSGRARAGLAMIDDKESRPPTLAEPAIALWRASLIALDTHSAADIATARAANLAAGPRSPGFALNAIMILPMLGELDAAFAIADGYLLRRGAYIGTLWTGNGQMPVNDQRWRRTMFLFTPATAPLRADPRFAALCEGIGLADYWRRRGIGPDYLRDRA